MRRLLVVLGVSALLVLSGGPALADAPFRLEEQVVDRVGALSGNESQVDDGDRRAGGRGRHAALRRLREQLRRHRREELGAVDRGAVTARRGRRAHRGGGGRRRVRVPPAAELDPDRRPRSTRRSSRRSARATSPAAWSPSRTSCAPTGTTRAQSEDSGSSGGAGPLLVLGGDRRRRWRRLPDRAVAAAQAGRAAPAGHAAGEARPVRRREHRAAAVPRQQCAAGASTRR